MSKFVSLLIAILVFSACALFSSCHESTPVNGNAVREEMENRKIKRVTKSMILEAAMQAGKQTTHTLDSLMNAELLKNPGIPSCVPLYHALSDSLSKACSVRIVRTGLTDLSSNNYSPKEKELMEAFRYSAQNGQNPGDNIQPLGDTVMLYNAPVLVQTACLPCHGEKAEVPAMPVNKKGSVNQPSKAASTTAGYKLNAPIGIYSLKPDIAELIRNIHTK